MEVTDSSNIYRKTCSDSVSLSINIIDEDADIPDLLIISITAIKSKINVDEKVRIVADIVNDDNEYDSSIISSYKWTEINGLLTSDEIDKYSEVIPNSFNFVLKSNVLQRGLTYSFQLEVFKTDSNDKLIASGVSSIATIYVINPPKIIKNSFVMFPKCMDGTITYESMEEYLASANQYSLSVKADGDNLPLLYQFGYKINDDDNYYNLHSDLLSISHLENVLLPIGDLELIVTVSDSEGAETSESIECNIELNSYTTCMSLDGFVDAIESYLTNHEKYSFILQESLIYLQYVYDQMDDDGHCTEDTLTTILKILNDEIGDLCHQENRFVILLSQVMRLWIDIGSMNEKFIDNKVENIKHLIFKILDPCSFIMEDIRYNVEELSVSTESIITNIPKIYHKELDITHYLSTIIVNKEYKESLYLLTDKLIELNTYLYTSDITNLISSVLYISSLSCISTSIPGEETAVSTFDEFSIYSIRVSNQNINVKVQNTEIFISDDILYESENDILQSIDTLIVGVNSASKNVNKSINNDKEKKTAILSDETISITILGNSMNTTHLASNINFTFNCNSKKKDCINHQCVWYNVDTDDWRDIGCNTIIDDVNNKIICSCCHLTTFATIYSINSEDGELIEDMETMIYWKYINWIFAVLFVIIAIYIIIEIYPFFVDKFLVYKQTSIGVMSLLGIICILYFIVCIKFYFDIDSNRFDGIEVITFILLLIQLLYFIIYALIFYAWFILSYSMKTSQDEYNEKIKKILFVTVLSFTLFTLIVYIMIISIESIKFLIFIQIFWSLILLIISTAFVIYSYYVAKMLMLTAKISSSQHFHSSDEATAKRLIFTNGCITIFFLIQLGLSIYFTVHSNKLNVIHHIIDISLNLLFILLLCWMYRYPMRRLTEFEANGKYHQYHCCCNKLLILNNNKKQEKQKNNNNKLPKAGTRMTTYSSDTATTTNTNTIGPRKSDAVRRRTTTGATPAIPAMPTIRDEIDMTLEISNNDLNIENQIELGDMHSFSNMAHVQELNHDQFYSPSPRQSVMNQCEIKQKSIS